jgi:hypothetical protein
MINWAISRVQNEPAARLPLLIISTQSLPVPLVLDARHHQLIVVSLSATHLIHSMYVSDTSLRVCHLVLIHS